MVLNKLSRFTDSLENPKFPLLGPTIEALSFFGVWETGDRLRIFAYKIFHYITVLFVISECIDLYANRNDINKFVNNMSMSILSIICVAKRFSYVLYQKEWQQLAADISKMELLLTKEGKTDAKKEIDSYIRYTRIITYSYWVLVFITNCFFILNPLLIYTASQSYRENIRIGKEPLPQIMFSWFPFDNTKVPGYYCGIMVHVVMGIHGSGVIAGYDMNAVAIMSYLKGQMKIVKYKCNSLFDDANTYREVLDRIRDCHKHHNILLKHYKAFNALMSPTMFLYMLMCSIGICGSVVQFISKEATTSQKLWVVQFTFGLVFQLFLFCWHGNDVTVMSIEVDRGVYSSDWWKADPRMRRQLTLLSGKLSYPFVLKAGPYTKLSVLTFIDILKHSYSFFTLFSQMQEN